VWEDETLEAFPAWTLAASGFAVGAVAGFATRRARLCTFGAIEDALMGGDTRRLRVFGLALGLAILSTQALIIGGLFEPGSTAYVNAGLPWLSILLGGLIFGVGMALVGTCSFGSLVRLGGGDLRSLVVVLVFGAAAYMTLRGALADFRVSVLESFVVTLSVPGGSDLPSMLARLVPADLRVGIAALSGSALILLAVIDRRLQRATRLLVAGTVLGLSIAAGWFLTTLLADEFSGPVRPQSLTFVGPVGKALYATLLDPASVLEFGVGSVFGVVVGAWLAARIADELRWEAFDDHHEMRRHLVGAVLMGVGGVMAGGCTIGQGLTAGSMLALSWPLAVGGIMVGGRIGIAILIEESMGDFVRRLLSRPADRRP
jgi:uncharacterized membrane protein YedE/YeeE